jgi:hypothetical protein
MARDLPNPRKSPDEAFAADVAALAAEMNRIRALPGGAFQSWVPDTFDGLGDSIARANADRLRFED